MTDEQRQETPEEAPESAPAGEHQTSSTAASDQAKMAAAQAKAAAGKAMAAFKGFDPLGQVYLGALGIALLLTLIFRFASYDAVEASGVDFGDMPVEWRTQMEVGMRAAENAANDAMPGFWRATWLGHFFAIFAVGGIGLCIWGAVAGVKFPWLPLALVGCGGVATLMFLLEWLFIQKGRDTALFGFYLPFIAVIVATLAAFSRMQQPAS